MIRRACGRRTRRDRQPIGVDGSVERAHPLQRVAEMILNDAVAGSETGGLPQQRQRCRLITAALELDRAFVEFAGPRLWGLCGGDLERRCGDREGSEAENAR